MKKEIWREIKTERLEEAQTIIFGIPFDENCSCGRGARKAPNTIRELSKYLPPVTEDGFIIDKKVYDYGNINKKGSLNNYFELLYQEMKKLLTNNKFVIAIGGDHSVSIPLRKAFFEKHQNQKVGLIHFDAHADFCDIYDNSKLSHACVNARSVEDGFCPSKILCVGLRSFEKQELEYFEKHPESKIIKASDIFEKKFEEIIVQIEESLYDCEAIYLSLDIDVLDPSIAPGTGTPETGGLDSRLLLQLIKKLMVDLNIKAMDVVEVAPPRDTNDITSWAALKIMMECIYYENRGKN